MISNEVANPTPTGIYFRESAFQATDETTNELINLLDDGLLNETFIVLQESADGSLQRLMGPSWKQDIGVSIEDSSGTSNLTMTHSTPWKRLQTL